MIKNNLTCILFIFCYGKYRHGKDALEERKNICKYLLNIELSQFDMYTIITLEHFFSNGMFVIINNFRYVFFSFGILQNISKWGKIKYTTHLYVYNTVCLMLKTYLLKCT